jgi:dihydrofolate reductase
MTKVLWHVTASLDGFIASADGSPGWMFEAGHAGPLGGEVMRRTGSILAGRRGFDLGGRAGDGARAIYGGAWSGPLIVLTHRPAPETPGVTFHPGPVPDAVAAARAAAGEKDVGVFGADVARQVLAADLLDEIYVHLVPVLLGDGLRLFAADHRVKLLRTRCEPGDQVVDLGFEVLRPRVPRDRPG